MLLELEPYFYWPQRQFQPCDTRVGGEGGIMGKCWNGLAV